MSSLKKWNDQAPRCRATRGQALVEFALVVPLLILLIVNAVNFGGFLFGWITVAGAARSGIEYFTAAGAAAGAPTTPTTAQINALVTADVSSLLNRSSLVVRVCTNKNSVVTCSGAGSSVPPADPEPASYVLATIDVTYTYQPLIPVFDFTKMAIHATLPGSTIHCRAAMRVSQ